MAEPVVVPCFSHKDNMKWGGIVAGLDGTIYCSPQFEDSVLIISKPTYVPQYIRLPVGFCIPPSMGFHGLACGHDSQLYFAPVVGALQASGAFADPEDVVFWASLVKKIHKR